MRVLILVGISISTIVGIAANAEEATVAAPPLFQGLVSHQRSMLSSRWYTLATPWFIGGNKNLSKEERLVRVKALGRAIERLVAALTCEQLEIAEKMGMVQVYLILTRFIKKYPSTDDQIVHVPDTEEIIPFWQEVFEKINADENAKSSPLKLLRSRRYLPSRRGDSLVLV